MQSINCLIVDDESISRDIISGYCSQLPEMHVVASCRDALQARQILETHPVDLLFLDIQMPILDGLKFLATLSQPPVIIFTTAYTDYAVKAFEADACDYLVKPFSFERFLIAVNKAKLRLHSKTNPSKSARKDAIEAIYIKSDKKIFNLPLDQILYAEAFRNNTNIITLNTPLSTKLPFSDFEKLLPADRFIRVHRSYIVHREKISYIMGNRIFVGKYEIPIGENYKPSFLSELGIS